MKFGEQRRNGGAAARGALVIVAIALVAAIGGVATWWLLRGSGGGDGRTALRRDDARATVPRVDAESADAAERTKEKLDRATDGKAGMGAADDASAAADSAEAPRDFYVHLFDEADGRAVENAALYVSPLDANALPNTTSEWGPVPALHVHSDTGLQPATEGALATGKSDRAGDAVVAVSSRRARLVYVLATGYAPVHCAAVDGRGTRARPLEIGLARTASLRGVVLGPDDRPLDGMRVRIEFDRRELLRPRPAFGTVVGAARAQCEVVTPSTGEFAFTGLPADVEIQLTAGSSEDDFQQWSQVLWLDPGEERELRWTLSRGGSVSGQIVGADGQPVAQAMVIVLNLQRGQGANSTADVLGNFHVAGVSAGDVAVQVAPNEDRHAVTVVLLNLADGEERTGVVVRVPDAAALIVRALDPDGRPVLPSEVHVFPPVCQLYCRDVVFEARLEEVPSWRLPRIPFGDVALRVRAPLTSSWPPVEVKFHHDGKHECEVRFAAGASLSGRLVDASNRDEPVVATATLLRRGASSFFWNATSMQSMAAPGTFEFTGLADGVYDVVAQADDGRVGVASNVWLGGGEPRSDVTVALAHGATLELIAPTTLGAPKSYAEAGSSIRFEARAAGAFVGAAFAVPFGRTHLTVPPGRVTIEAIAAGESIGTREVEAKLGEVVRVRF